MTQLPRLYRILISKYSTVASFCSLWNANIEHTIWYRNLFSRDYLEISQLANIISTISITPNEDCLLWEPDKGTFNSKTCAELILSQDFPNNVGSRNWKSIWNITAPPKVTVFLWKIHWNILPTSKFLSSRIHFISPIYSWCNSEEETIHHLFWACQVASSVWSFVRSWWSLSSELQRIRLFSLINIFKLRTKGLQFKLWGLVVAASTWTIWLARNEWKFSGKKSSKELLILLLFERIKKWGKATGILPFVDDQLWMSNPRGAIAVHSHIVKKEFWDYKRTSFDLICAIDGAWFVSDTGPIGGIRGQVSNKEGKIIYTFSGPVKALNSLEAEIEAIIHVILLILNNKFQHGRIVICSDSNEAMGHIRNGLRFFSSSLGHIQNLRLMVDGLFSLAFVPRELNDTADSLAKSGLSKSLLFSHWA